MKKMNKLIHLVVLSFMCFFASGLSVNQNDSSISHLKLSLWSEYQNNHFEGLTQLQKTEKLQKIFQDKLNFAKKHNIRRLIVKILDPQSFDFFHPNHFDVESSDNFCYWAAQLNNHVTIEALFDCSSFQFSKKSVFDRLTSYYDALGDYFGKQENPFGNFENIIEKMEWVSWTNEAYGANQKKRPLIAGITLDPRGIGNSEAYYQNLINAFDQFRFQGQAGCIVPKWIPENSFYRLTVSIFLPLDMKDFALANAACFPLTSELRSQKGGIGIELPSDFPSSGPDFPPPNWRAENQLTSLLDSVYLQMSDERLVPHVYQNYDILSKPDQPSTDHIIRETVINLVKTMTGVPFVKGPGNISCQQGSNLVTGNYTFFRTGSSKGEGQFISNQTIEIRKPFVDSTIAREIIGIPDSNRKMRVSSAFSTTFPLDSVEYWHTPIPCNWSQPKISKGVQSKLYFVFSTVCEPNRNRFFGNWRFGNFMSFLQYRNTKEAFGFIHFNLFTDLNGKPVKPHNNLVLYDFSTLPNGDPFPDCNWELGNHNY